MSNNISITITAESLDQLGEKIAHLHSRYNGNSAPVMPAPALDKIAPGSSENISAPTPGQNAAIDIKPETAAKPKKATTAKKADVAVAATPAAGQPDPFATTPQAAAKPSDPFATTSAAAQPGAVTPVADPALEAKKAAHEALKLEAHNALTKLNGKKGMPVAIATLKEFGVDRQSLLKPDQLAAFIARCEVVAAAA